MKHKTTPVVTLNGKAEEAMNFYDSIFRQSEITYLEKYSADDSGETGKVKLGVLEYLGQEYMFIDNPNHSEQVSAPITLHVKCESDEEFDLLRRKLDEKAQWFPAPEYFNHWLLVSRVQDKYGIRWILDRTKNTKKVSEPVSQRDLELVLIRTNYQFWGQGLPYLPRTREVFAAFLEAFDAVKSPNYDEWKYPEPDYVSITKRFSRFMSQNYQIRHVNWHSQVDTYAYRTNQNWYDAFSELFRAFTEVFPHGLEEEEPDDEELLNLTLRGDFPQPYEISPELNSQEILHVDGVTIRVGTILRLSDLIGNDYKKTVHYDLYIRDPDWSLYEASESDFKFVKLCSLANSSKSETTKSYTFERLRRVCSGYASEVRYIGFRENRSFVYTDHLEIEIESALEAKEVMVDDHINEIDKKTSQILQYQFRHSLRGDDYYPYLEKLDRLYREIINDGHLEWSNYQSGFGGWYTTHDRKPVRHILPDSDKI